MNKCFQGLVGIRGGCEDDRALYYLDDIGIGLKDASRSVDSKFLSGSKLVESKIEQAWKMVINEVVIQGFELNKIACEVSLGSISSTQSELVGGTHEIKVKRYSSSRMTSTYIGAVLVSLVSGSYTLTVTDGYDTVSYTGSDKTVNIRRSFFGDEITLTINLGVNAKVLSGSLGELSSCRYYVGSACTLNYSGGSNFGLEFDVQAKCDKDRFLCKYAEILAEAVQYKSAALILKEVMDNDRLNDFKLMKTDSLMMNLAMLDSTFNMFQFESAEAATKVPKGMYQQVMERISKSIPAPKDSVCVACNAGKYVNTLP